MKILVVDDDVEILKMLKTFLEKGGHDVLCVENAQEGKRLALVERPDLVLIDIRLPDINGIELLSQIKEIDKDVIAVMITAYKDAEKVIDAFRAGAFDCLLKPFDFNYLTDNVLNKVPRRVR
ncbi:MAG: response regulator [bacterium]